MYSVLSSRPSKVRVMSTRPWTSSAKIVELIDSAFAEVDLVSYGERCGEVGGRR